MSSDNFTSLGWHFSVGHNSYDPYHRLRFVAYHTTSAHVSKSPPGVVVLGNNHVVAMTYAEDDSRYYVDGQMLDATVSSNADGSYRSGDTGDDVGLRIGEEYYRGGRFHYQGVIGFVYLYNRVLAPNEASLITQDPYAIFRQPIHVANITDDVATLPTYVVDRWGNNVYPNGDMVGRWL